MRRGTGAALFILLCVLWGSTWLVIKVGYGGLGPFNAAAVRFFVASACFAVIVPLVKTRWPRGRDEWTLVFWVGIVLFAADYGLIYWAELFIDSGLSAILFATHPLTTALLAHAYIPGDRMTARKLGGTLLTFLGVAALFADRIRIDSSKIWPMAAIVAAALCGGMATVASKRHGHDLHPAALNAPAMLIGALILAAASLLAGDGFAIPGDLPTWSAVLYLAAAGSVVTFFVYFTLLKKWSATTLSFIAIFTPAVAVILGFIFRNETLTRSAALGGALILGGVALALTSRKPS